MMYYPSFGSKQINQHNNRKGLSMIEDFRGYNANLRISDGELRDMKNMCSDKYPALAPRQKRKRVRALTAPHALYMHNSLCWVDGTKFYYGGVEKGTLTNSTAERTLVGMGAYVLIFPDNMYYNTSDDSFGNLGNEVDSTETVNFTLCKATGTDYANYTTTKPETPTDGQLWIDTTETPHVLKQYSSSYEMWTSIPTTYVKIASDGIGEGFSEQDGVTISGVTASGCDVLNGEYTLYGVGDDYVIVTAIIDAVGQQAGTGENKLTIKREIPAMDYVTELNNRIWGCSNAKHEIYACKLGDPKVWKQYLNISTDSFAATVGSKGNFTGAATQLGSVLFFKENVIHEIMGSKPSNFKIEDSNARGVMAGCNKSLVVVNETLFYKSIEDICSFGTSVPREISYALGDERYSDAVGGRCGFKYYLSLKDTNNHYHLFVYDITKDMWHREDDTQMKFTATVGDDLYFIDGSNVLYAVHGYGTAYDDANAATESSFGWMAEFGDMGLNSPDKKYIAKLQIRMRATYPASVKISVMYDNSGNWEVVYNISDTHLASFVANIIPRRCDTMRLKIEGTGEVEIYSIAKTTENGSEM